MRVIGAVVGLIDRLCKGLLYGGRLSSGANYALRKLPFMPGPNLRRGNPLWLPSYLFSFDGDLCITVIPAKAGIQSPSSPILGEEVR